MYHNNLIREPCTISCCVMCYLIAILYWIDFLSHHHTERQHIIFLRFHPAIPNYPVTISLHVNIIVYSTALMWVCSTAEFLFSSCRRWMSECSSTSLPSHHIPELLFYFAATPPYTRIPLNTVALLVHFVASAALVCRWCYKMTA